ncbi:MAG: hypothetical protein AAF901_12960 [Bacteroidota bacterium]
MNRIIGLIVLLVVTFQFNGNSQSLRNLKEAGDNNKAIQVGKKQLETDIAQLATFKSKVNNLENAFKGQKLAEVKVLKVDILSDMRREVQQSEQKIIQDKKELNQSGAELRSSNREVRYSRRDRAIRDGDIGDGRDLRDDRRDKRDDQRDLNDDKRDLETQKVLTARQKQILNTLEAFTFSIEPTAKEKCIANIKLMNEFIETMEKDIAFTKAELAEDQIEKREDRRERSEDRRERRERKRNF